MKYAATVLQQLQQLAVFGKFGRDVVWNIASIAVLGITGILVSVIIGRFYGPSYLGVFNQVFAIYIVATQFAVGGLQFSVLKHISQYANKRDICNLIISAAVGITIPLSVVICAIVFGLSNFIGFALGSSDVSAGLLYALPGIGCFAINKVLLAVINGYRHMRAYAVFQALRYVLMLLFLVIAMAVHFPGEKLAVILSGAEITLLIFLALYTSRLFSPIVPDKWQGWATKHITFGVKAFTGGALLEINSRVDILLLGVFASDYTVGIYSLAAIVVEGIAQIAVALRNNINPIITSMYFNDRKDELCRIIRRGIKLFYIVSIIIFVMACIAYPFFVNLFIGSGDFMASWPPFCILMLGLTLSSGYSPFKMLLNQTGYPAQQSFLIAAIVLSNVILNSLLIPLMGMYGAAAGTATMFVLSALYLKLMARRYAHLDI
jgi:O-antigen/teichoic acid export membrane protein